MIPSGLAIINVNSLQGVRFLTLILYEDDRVSRLVAQPVNMIENE